MPNRKHQYYVGDVVTFRGVWEIDGVEQTPDDGTALVEIWKTGTATAVKASGAATIATNQVRYQYTTTEIGEFCIFLSAEFNSGADKRTGSMEFTVETKKAF